MDGLRSIAVVAVVCYHLGLSCPGGFVGVDIFFVLSGYLITGLLLRDFAHDRLSLLQFWERRVRRIFPAAAAMVLVTLAVGSVVLLRSDFVMLAKSAVAQTAILANVFFLRQQGGYFTGLDIHPLLHTWSLAVEEQFYFFYPILLFGAHRLRKHFGEHIVWRCILAGIAVSFVLAALRLPARPNAVFFLLPYRAWELLGGGLLAALPIRALPSHPRWRELGGWIGLVGLVLPIFAYTKDTPFPGIAALPPCLGTMAVIWSNSTTATSPGLNTVGRLLAGRIPVFIGLVSYSFYLWHWPVTVFAQYGLASHEELPLAHRLGAMALSFGLAVASWRWVETPFRTRTVAPSRRGVFAFGAVGSAVLVVLSLAGYRYGGFSGHLPGELGAAMRANSLALEGRGPFFNVDAAAVRSGQVRRLGNLEREQSSILLWGDSHARHALPALDALCRELGIAGEAIVYSSTPPLFDAPFETDVGLDERSPEWAEAVLARIRAQSIKGVVLAAYWRGRQGDDRVLLETALRNTVKRLADAGCTVWVLMDVPDCDIVPARALARAAWLGRSPEDWRRTEEEHLQANAVVYAVSRDNLPAIFIDPSQSLREATGPRYTVRHDDLTLYYDKHHLTPTGSLHVLLPLMRQQIAPVLVRQGGLDPVVAHAARQ